MKYEVFSKIWDQTIDENPRDKQDLKEANLNPSLISALIEYDKGNKAPMEILKRDFYDNLYNKKKANA